MSFIFCSAVHLYPHRFLGAVGHHDDNFGVDRIDVSAGGDIVASIAQDAKVKFWNIGYLEVTNNMRSLKKTRLSLEIENWAFLIFCTQINFVPFLYLFLPANGLQQNEEAVPQPEEAARPPERAENGGGQRTGTSTALV